MVLAIWMELLSNDALIPPSDEPMFRLETDSMFVEDGDWHVIGNGEPPQGLGFGRYKVGGSGGPDGPFYEVFLDGTRGRVLTPEEAATLKFGSSYSPAVVPHLIRIAHGVAEWRPFVDDVLIPSSAQPAASAARDRESASRVVSGSR